jgi:Family of unknown function (DUF6463)
MRRLSGPLLMATGLLDLLYVLAFHSRQLAAIAQDGFFDAVETNPAQFDRETAFWHVTFGVTVLILGGLVGWAQERTGTLPAFLGWSLLALGLSGVILMPVSGFWLILPQAMLMLVVARRGRPWRPGNRRERSYGRAADESGEKPETVPARPLDGKESL